MKRIRYQAGGNAGLGPIYRSGNEIVTIPAGSQITLVRVIPGFSEVPDPSDGTWFSINEGGPVFLQTSLCLDSDVFGYCCECDVDDCDRYPGDVPITMRVGPLAAPQSNSGDGVPTGLPANEWQVWYIEGMTGRRRKGCD